MFSQIKDKILTDWDYAYYFSVNPYAAGGWFGQYKMMHKSWKVTETLANGYSYASTQWELSNEYQHDRVWMVFKNLCICVCWKKIASALEGLSQSYLEI